MLILLPYIGLSALLCSEFNALSLTNEVGSAEAQAENTYNQLSQED